MTIGQTIGAARIEQGLSIEELSEKTRIRPAVLVGIESDNFDACGGEAYARGHIRSVASTLGLDAAVLLDQFATQVGAPSRSAITVCCKSTHGVSPSVRLAIGRSRPYQPCHPV